jgi:beta-N-acetylhexosaminidase
MPINGRASSDVVDDPDQLIDGSLMLAFEGDVANEELLSLVRTRSPSGFTLFEHNVADSEQVRSLTGALQEASRAALPLLIAADQEGGQLLALDEGTTQWAGNMALGAAGDVALTERVGRAMAREMRAVGINVNYAPVCDVATNADNPSLGIRSFGDDPVAVGRHAAAMVAGLQSEGVAATLKHFPGKGAAREDPHHELPRLDLDADRLERVEFAPFRAGISAGARMIMVGHYGVPAITGFGDRPTSLAPETVRVLRRQLGHRGVVITDALDMGALAQGPLQAIDAAAAVRAGNDLLLCASDAKGQARIRSGARHALARGLIDVRALNGARRRTERLRRWVARFKQPDLDVVACKEHLDLAKELARRSITLVRDDAGLLPLRVASDDAIAAIMPRPRNLTPADTSADVIPGLAAALRSHHARVDEFITDPIPTDANIASLCEQASRYALLVIGTVFAPAHPEQVALVRALLNSGRPAIVVALRTPHDLVAFPEARTYLCTYGARPPSLEALSDALWGMKSIGGRLPVAVGSLYPRCHGLKRAAIV